MAYDYGLISWRLESGGLFRALIGFIMIVSGVTPVLAFYVDCIIDWSDCLVSRKYLQEDVAVESPRKRRKRRRKKLRHC
nr:hypothetical protein [Parabacteroides distasonis]